MIDLSKLDPYLLYEFDRQLKEVVDSDTYMSLSFDAEDGMFYLYFYGNKPKWHELCRGSDKSLVVAVRKCGESLAAAKENLEASNG